VDIGRFHALGRVEASFKPEFLGQWPSQNMPCITPFKLWFGKIVSKLLKVTICEGNDHAPWILACPIFRQPWICTGFLPSPFVGLVTRLRDFAQATLPPFGTAAGTHCPQRVHCPPGCNHKSSDTKHTS
jgi:hypothetical protein